MDVNAGKEEKTANMMKMTADIVVAFDAFGKSGGKTIYKICIKKALAKSLVTFKLRGSRLLSKDWFPCRDKASVHTAS